MCICGVFMRVDVRRKYVHDCMPVYVCVYRPDTLPITEVDAHADPSLRVDLDPDINYDITFGELIGIPRPDNLQIFKPANISQCQIV